MENNVEQPQDLLNFQWETDEVSEFFSNNDIDNPETIKEFEKESGTNEKFDEKELEDKIEKKSNKKTKTSNIKNKEENEDVENIENEEEEKEKIPDSEFFEDLEDKQVEDNKNLNIYQKLFQELKEKEMLSFELEENVEIKDLEDFITLQEKEVATRLENKMEQFANSLPEDGKLYLKYLKEGGDSNKFFDILKKVNTIPSYNEKDDFSKKNVVSYYLKHYKDLDEEDINDTINTMEEKGILDKYALKYDTFLKEKKKKERDVEISKQEQEKQLVEQKKKEFQSDLTNFLNNTKEIKGLKITPKEKTDLIDYIFTPVKRTDNGTYVTNFNLDLQKVFKEKEKIVLLAKLLKSDLSLDDIKKNLENKIIKKTKTKLNEAIVPRTSETNLADFF